MDSPPAETRERYPYWVSIPTRWMDGTSRPAYASVMPPAGSEGSQPATA